MAPTSSGFDVDRVVLSSDRAGEPTPVRPAGAPIRDAGARVSIESSTDDAYDLRVRTDGSPFWLVLGQSHNDGWEATVDGQSLGAPTLVNGFANGWTVRPDAPGTLDIALRWTPQRAVWIGIAASVIAVLVCIVLVVARRRRAPAMTEPALFDPPTPTSPTTFGAITPGLGATLGAAVAAGVVTALVTRWWIGLIVAIATALAPVVTRGRLFLAAGAPIALALGALLDVPELGWVAIGLLIADLVAGWWWRRRNP